MIVYICLHIPLYQEYPLHIPPSHLAPSASQPPYPLIQRIILLILISPGTMAGLSFFRWWGIPSVDWWYGSHTSLGYWYRNVVSKAGPCLMSNSHWENSVWSGVCCKHMLTCNGSTSIRFHRCDFCKDASMTSAPEPSGITGTICWKSPPNTIVSPLKGLWQSQTSWRVWSRALKQCWWAIKHSS